jgi:hypothetical protein
MKSRLEGPLKYAEELRSPLIEVTRIVFLKEELGGIERVYVKEFPLAIWR